MPRAQNAHAYVNAGFLMEFDNSTGNVRNASIVYGGINSSVKLLIHLTYFVDNL